MTERLVALLDTGLSPTAIALAEHWFIVPGEVPATLRWQDIDADGLLSLRDLNHPANHRLVKDSNRNGWIDPDDVLASKRITNGRDDDGNGYIDDLFGWDFLDQDNRPWDTQGHGTAMGHLIAPTVAHWGSGVESLAWLLPLRILSEGHRQSGSLPVLLQALAYTRQLQTAISEQGIETQINAAWAHYGAPEVLIDALIDTLNAGITVVAAAGNDAVRDLAASPRLPASLMHPNLQVVASTDTSGELSRFSAFDPRYVTTLALGEDVLSLGLSQQPLSLNGSSVATALVSGLGSDSGTLAPSPLQSIAPWLTSSYTSVVGAKKHLKGGRGDDWLQGLATDQTLNAGKGQNVLIGGGGADRFVVSADGRTDVIVDFNSREGDTLRILHAAKKNLWFDALAQTVWHDRPNDTTPAQAVVVLVGVTELPESAWLG